MSSGALANFNIAYNGLQLAEVREYGEEIFNLTTKL